MFVKSEVAAQRVFDSVERYLTTKLKLVVNRDKSRVCRTDGVEFLGYQFHGYGGQIRVSPKNVRKLKQRAREILNCNRGISMTRRLNELRLYLRGWIVYFVLEQRKSIAITLDKCPLVLKTQGDESARVTGPVGAYHARDCES